MRDSTLYSSEMEPSERAAERTDSTTPAQKNSLPRVAFVCGGHSWGGLEMNVLRMTQWLREDGVPIYIFAALDSPLHSEAVRAGVDVEPYSARGKADLMAARKLARAWKVSGTAVVVVHTRRDIPVVVLAGLFSGNSPALMYYQHMHLGGSKRDRYHRWLYGRLDAWIAPLPMFAKRVAAATTIRPEQIVTIPLAIDVSQFLEITPSRRAEARRALELPQDAAMVGTVGRLDPKKGQDTLVRALSRLKANGQTGVHALFVGDLTRGEGEDYKKLLDRLCKENRLADVVHFRPHMDDVATAYSAMDIFALTSHSETYGMVTLEAMACGLPVIGTADGGTVELIDDGRTGVLVPPKDDAALADAIGRLLDEPQKASIMGAAARAQVVANFDRSAQMRKLIELFSRRSSSRLES